MANQGNPIECPYCGERIPRIAAVLFMHLKEVHGVDATRAELHRMASPKYRAEKAKPQIGGDLMDHVVSGGGFESKRRRH